MLDERQLALASLFLAVTGIAVLFLAGSWLAPHKVPISEIGKGLVGERVAVEGRIEWAREGENYVLFTLSDGAKIKAIKFGPTQEERAAARERAFVVVTGKVQIYKNELEIVAEEIRG